MNGNYGDMFSGAGGRGQDDQHLMNTWRALQQNAAGQPNYEAFMAASQMGNPQAMNRQQASIAAHYLQQYQRLHQEARNAAAEHRADSAHRPDISSHDLMQQQLQRQAMLQQQAINAQRQPPVSHQQPKPRASNIIPHKSAAQYANKPPLNAYQQYQQQAAQAQTLANTSTNAISNSPLSVSTHGQGDMPPRQISGTVQHQVTSSAPQSQQSQQSQQTQHSSMDYSQHTAAHLQGLQTRVPTSQPQTHEQQHTRYSTVPDTNTRVPPTNRYVPLKGMPSSQQQHPHQQQQPLPQQQQPQQQSQIAHHSPQQQTNQHKQHHQQTQPSPRDLQHQQSPGDIQHQQHLPPTSTIHQTQSSSSVEPRHSIDHRKAQSEHLAMQQQTATRTKPPARPAPPGFVPMKMDSMRKAKMAEEQAKLSAANVEKSTPPQTQSQTAQPPSSQPLRMPKPATRVPYKMDSMRAQRAEKSDGDSLSSHLGSSSHLAASNSSNQPQTQTHQQRVTPSDTTASSKSSQQTPQISKIVPHKMSSMKNRPEPSTRADSESQPIQRPPISRHVPYKTASMHKNKMAASAEAAAADQTQPAADADDEDSSSSSSSSSDSSSSSSSSGESDDEKATTNKNVNPDPPASQQPSESPPKQCIVPPVRTIPFKTQGIQRPPNTIPSKKPKGKPLTLIKEKAKSTAPTSAPKPKTTGKPDSMLELINKGEFGESVEQEHPVKKRPGRPPKAGRTPPSSKPAEMPPEPVAHPTPPNQSQFETISDNESPSSLEPIPKKKRGPGRPPKNKGKETPSMVSPSPAPEVPATPTFPEGGMFGTPRSGDPSQTPNFLPSATPRTVPSTPVFSAETPLTGELFGGFMTPKEPMPGLMTPKEPLAKDSEEVDSKRSPPKRGRGRPPKKTVNRDEEDSSKSKQSAKSEDIMDIVSNVTKNITNFGDSKDDAPFELTWTGPMATPSSMDMFSSPSSSMLPPYTPMSTSGATPYNPPSMSNRTPFLTHSGMKTPFSVHGGGVTPFIHGGKTPLQSRAVTDLVTKQSPARSPAQGGSSNREDDGKKRRTVGRKRRGRRRQQEEEREEENVTEPESPPAFFAGLIDMPPMDVSGESFRLESRARNPDVHKDNQEKLSTTQSTNQGHAKLFGALDLTASMSSDKPAGGDDDDDVQLPPPDAQFSKETGGKKSKKGKRIKKQKPYNKRQSKIQNLDPLFISDMESISDRIGSCSLYAGTPPQYTAPKYISAFGELALVHPPPKPHPTPIESQKLTGRGGKTSGKQTTKREKQTKIKIKVKLDDIKPPSVDETESVQSLTSPTEIMEKILEKSDEAAAATLTPLPGITEPLTTASAESTVTAAPLPPPAAHKATSSPDKKTTEEPKENKGLKSTNLNYDAKLSAPEVGQKYFVPRGPRSRPIASKNISFNKSKNKKPKYGKGSSPHPLSDTEKDDGERRQLPSRKSRPHHLLDDEAVPGEEESILDEQENSNPPPVNPTVNSSPIPKRGPGRPPKPKSEIPHTNLVRTNQSYLPLKKRHKMVIEEYAELMPEMPVPSAMEAISSDKQVSPRPERPNSSQGRKRPAPSLQRELTALASDEGVQGVTEKKRRTAAITSELRQQQGSLSALQAALEQARLNKVKTDKQKRKNPTPARNTLADVTPANSADSTSITESAEGDTATASDEMDVDSTDSSTEKKGKDGGAKKKANKNGSGKNQALNYKKINKCIYHNGVKPLVPGFEAHSCSCKKPDDLRMKSCHDDCLNRMLYTECTPQTCPCGEQCANMRIQKQTTAHGLEKIQTTDRGFGVKTTNLICSGEFILEYTGEVVNIDEFRRRMAFEYARDHHHYCLTLDSKFVIDGYRMGNIGRFVNHSCEPNCEMQKWNVNGVYRIGLFALKDISPGEELTYDYNFKAFNMDAQQKCFCGAAKCREFMGGKSQSLAHPHNKSAKKKGKSNMPKFNPKDPIVIKQRAIMMPSEEKRFVRSQQCFLMRNMTGQVPPPPPPPPPKKINTVQPFKTLLPYKTDSKILDKEYRVASKKDTENEEVIRCICGVLREEGDMLMCDKCEVWQHCDCMGVSPDVDNYLCDRCAGRQMSSEVAMIPPPPDSIPEYKYFLSLDHGAIHVAVGDAVYMTPSDPHLGLYPYRIERLWKDPRGDKYVYGFFYYLPWKLPNRVDQTKKFYPNEVVQTKFYDILPLRNVRGHCYVIDEKSYCEGRPKDYTGEKDIFICEYELDKLFRELKKITRRREAELVNKYHYAFNYFKKPIEVKQYHSPNLKKAYDTKKEVKPEPAPKPRKVKKARLAAVEDVVKTLAGKAKLALVDVNSLTRKRLEGVPHIQVKAPPKPPASVSKSKPKQAQQKPTETAKDLLRSQKKDLTAVTMTAKQVKESDVKQPSDMKSKTELRAKPDSKGKQDGKSKADSKPKSDEKSDSKTVERDQTSPKISEKKVVSTKEKTAPTLEKMDTVQSSKDATTLPVKGKGRGRGAKGRKSPSTDKERTTPTPDKAVEETAADKEKVSVEKKSNDDSKSEKISTSNKSSKAKSRDLESTNKIDDKVKKATDSSGKKSRGKPPAKQQASIKGKKNKALPQQTAVANLPKIPKKRSASEMSTDKADEVITPAPALRRGRSSSTRSNETTPEPPKVSSKSDKKGSSSQDKSDAKGSVKVDKKGVKSDKSTKSKTLENKKEKTQSKDNEKPKSIMTDESISEVKTALPAVKLARLEDKDKKVQMTIASRDGDHSSGSMIGFARARNNMVKTPIVVKRTEPGKEPVLSDPKVTVQKATGAQQSILNPTTDSAKTVQQLASAPVQKRGILKNAVPALPAMPSMRPVAMPMLRLSPINVESYHRAKAELLAERDSPASPEKPADEVAGKSVVAESPASPTIPDKPVEVPPTQNKKAKAKKIVDIAEVLRRGKEKQVKEAAEKAAEGKDKPDEAKAAMPAMVSEKPNSPPPSEEPSSPVKAPSDILSPPANKLKGPKVIPLIPLSPTHEPSSDEGMKLTDTGPLAIPLSPTNPSDVCPSSPVSELRASKNDGPVAIPLSPTSLQQSSAGECKSDHPPSMTKSLETTFMTPVSQAPQSQVRAGTPIITEEPPAFLNASTDDDSDGEPMLSIAEEITTPVREKLNTSQRDSGQIEAAKVALQFEPQTQQIDEVKVQTTEAASTPSPKAVTSVTDMLKDFVEDTSEDSSNQKSATDPVTRNEKTASPSFAPVFGVLSSSFSFDSFVARPLAEPKPNVSRRRDTESPDSDKEMEMLAAETDEKAIAKADKQSDMPSAETLASTSCYEGDKVELSPHSPTKTSASEFEMTTKQEESSEVGNPQSPSLDDRPEDSLMMTKVIPHDLQMTDEKIDSATTKVIANEIKEQIPTIPGDQDPDNPTSLTIQEATDSSDGVSFEKSGESMSMKSPTEVFRDLEPEHSSLSLGHSSLEILEASSDAEVCEDKPKADEGAPVKSGEAEPLAVSSDADTSGDKFDSQNPDMSEVAGVEHGIESPGSPSEIQEPSSPAPIPSVLISQPLKVVPLDSVVISDETEKSGDNISGALDCGADEADIEWIKPPLRDNVEEKKGEDEPRSGFSYDAETTLSISADNFKDPATSTTEEPSNDTLKETEISSEASKSSSVNEGDEQAQVPKEDIADSMTATADTGTLATSGESSYPVTSAESSAREESRSQDTETHRTLEHEGVGGNVGKSERGDSEGPEEYRSANETADLETVGAETEHSVVDIPAGDSTQLQCSSETVAIQQDDDQDDSTAGNTHISSPSNSAAEPITTLDVQPGHQSDGTQGFEKHDPKDGNEESHNLTFDRSSTDVDRSTLKAAETELPLALDVSKTESSASTESSNESTSALPVQTAPSPTHVAAETDSADITHVDGKADLPDHPAQTEPTRLTHASTEEQSDLQQSTASDEPHLSATQELTVSTPSVTTELTGPSITTQASFHQEALTSSQAALTTAYLDDVEQEIPNGTPTEKYKTNSDIPSAAPTGSKESTESTTSLPLADADGGEITGSQMQSTSERPHHTEQQHTERLHTEQQQLHTEQSNEISQIRTSYQPAVEEPYEYIPAEQEASVEVPSAMISTTDAVTDTQEKFSDPITAEERQQEIQQSPTPSVHSIDESMSGDRMGSMETELPTVPTSVATDTSEDNTTQLHVPSPQSLAESTLVAKKVSIDANEADLEMDSNIGQGEIGKAYQSQENLDQNLTDDIEQPSSPPASSEIMSEVQQSAIPAPAVEDIAITDDTNQSEKTSETTVSASEAEVLITHGEDDDEESSQAPDELSSDTTGKAIESPESPQAVEPEEQLNSDNKTEYENTEDGASAAEELADITTQQQTEDNSSEMRDELHQDQSESNTQNSSSHVAPQSDDDGKSVVSLEEADESSLGVEETLTSSSESLVISQKSPVLSPETPAESQVNPEKSAVISQDPPVDHELSPLSPDESPSSPEQSEHGELDTPFVHSKLDTPSVHTTLEDKAEGKASLDANSELYTSVECAMEQDLTAPGDVVMGLRSELTAADSPGDAEEDKSACSETMPKVNSNDDMSYSHEHDEATDLVEPADSTPKDADPGQSSSNEAVGFCSMEDSMHVADDVVGDKQHADSIAEEGKEHVEHAVTDIPEEFESTEGSVLGEKSDIFEDDSMTAESSVMTKNFETAAESVTCEESTAAVESMTAEGETEAAKGYVISDESTPARDSETIDKSGTACLADRQVEKQVTAEEFLIADESDTYGESKTAENPAKAEESETEGSETAEDSVTADDSETAKESVTAEENKTAETVTVEQTEAAGESEAAEETSVPAAESVTAGESKTAEESETAEKVTGEENNTAEDSASGEESGAAEDSASAEATVSANESLTAEESKTAEENKRAEDSASAEETNTVEDYLTAEESETVEENKTGEDSDTVENSMTAQENKTEESVAAEDSDTVEESVTAKKSETTADSVTCEENETAKGSVTAEEDKTTEESLTAEESLTVEESEPAEENETEESMTAEQIEAAEESMTAEKQTGEENNTAEESYIVGESVTDEQSASAEDSVTAEEKRTAESVTAEQTEAAGESVTAEMFETAEESGTEESEPAEENETEESMNAEQIAAAEESVTAENQTGEENNTAEESYIVGESVTDEQSASAKDSVTAEEKRTAESVTAEQTETAGESETADKSETAEESGTATTEQLYDKEEQQDLEGNEDDQVVGTGDHELTSTEREPKISGLAMLGSYGSDSDED